MRELVGWLIATAPWCQLILTSVSGGSARDALRDSVIIVALLLLVWNVVFLGKHWLRMYREARDG